MSYNLKGFVVILYGDMSSIIEGMELLKAKTHGQTFPFYISVLVLVSVKVLLVKAMG